ncbi:MAG: FtsK/SpoIIIE domain-containing protein [Micrococcales bacterium]|nr:FtsK/SpoIIIE domain-containing protein [Micrococcales bacterium]
MSPDSLKVAEWVSLGQTSLPLLGSANIWVEDTLANDLSVKVTQLVMLQALQATAPGQLEMTVFDDGLSGLAAPFWPLNSGGEKILHLLHDQQDFKSTLRYLRDHVQGVKNVMQGLAPNLVAFRNEVDYPVEGYKLIVVSTDFSALDEQSQFDLSVLLKAGPTAGVSFIVHSMTLGANPAVVASCQYLKVERGLIRHDDGDTVGGWEPPQPKHLISLSRKVANHLATAQVDPLAFTEIQPVEQAWQNTSEDGLTFAIGRYGLQTVEITLGDELNQRHNMLVTGAVGQGKSNLISVIIHSLCQRYSPAEIQLYLLDFKEGVTLQPFSDPATGLYLPHARVLGLEADREFGLSVLRRLFGIYRSRMKAFKEAGVQDLRHFRHLNSGQPMPRIVVIIDEFQMMFAERDKVSDEIADLLVRGVRLFRACGIHVILASQTIGGNLSLAGSVGEGLFGQVPVRVALKNSLAESHATLGPRNDAAAHLRAREAVVNQDYGDISANRKTSIAFADESLFGRLRNDWWLDSRGQSRPPFVFAGERRRSLADDLPTRTRPSHQTQATVLLGSRIEVDAHPLEVPFGRDIGRNIVLVGAGEAVIEIENIALSLAVQRPDSRFVVLDCLEANASWDNTHAVFTQAMTGLSADLTVVPRPEVEQFIANLAGSLPQRQDAQDLVVIGLGMDRIRAMPAEFPDLVQTGPTSGVHFIGWWLKLDAFREHIGYGGESAFDIRLGLRLDAQSAKQLMSDPLLDWKPADNRMLAWDSTELPEAIRVIPYSLLDPTLVDTARAQT